MVFSTKFTPPKPQLYDLHFSHDRNLRYAEEFDIEAIGSISRFDGQASMKALLTSEQRANISKYAHLRPLGRD